MQNVRHEDNTEKRQCSRIGNSPKRGATQRQNIFTESTQSSNVGSTNNVISAQWEHINLSQHTGNGIAGEQEKIVKGSKKDVSERSANTDNMDVCLTKCRDEDIQGSCEVIEMQRISKACLPQWTDEQLDQLFAGDDEDDASLFS